MTIGGTRRGYFKFKEKTMNVRWLAAACAAFLVGNPALADDLRVGVLLPLTGPSADGGRDMQRGFEIATEMQNEQGGINGRKVVLVVADAVDVKTGRSEAERLIQVEGAKVIMGTYVSAIAFAASEVAERAGTFYWEVNSVADAITERGFKHTFRPSIKGSNVGQVGIDFIKGELAPKLSIAPDKLRLVIVFEDSIFGSTAAKAIEQYAKNAGVPVIESVSYNRSSNDLSSVVLRARSARPDVVFIASYIPDGTLFLKQSKQMGLRPKAIFTYGVFNDMNVKEALGEDIENLFCVSWPAGGVEPEKLTAEAGREYASFSARFKERYKVDRVPQFSAAAFAGATALYREVLAKAPSLDPGALRTAALAVDVPEGSSAYGFGIKFGPDGQNQRSYNVTWQWQGGQPSIVWPARLATRPPNFDRPLGR
jgi:branched-chain amino acid transport system substrate-binding protein